MGSNTELVKTVHECSSRIFRVAGDSRLKNNSDSSEYSDHGPKTLRYFVIVASYVASVHSGEAILLRYKPQATL